jgi:hypothetical protein
MFVAPMIDSNSQGYDDPLGMTNFDSSMIDLTNPSDIFQVSI